MEELESPNHNDVVFKTHFSFKPKNIFIIQWTNTRYLVNTKISSVIFFLQNIKRLFSKKNKIKIYLMSGLIYGFSKYLLPFRSAQQEKC